jgi:hypothetical protein
MDKVKALVLFSIFMFAVPAIAQDFSGNWFMNANGWTFNLHLTQRGNKVSGKLIPINSNNPISKIDGTVYGHKIIFFRTSRDLQTPQEYHGFLFERDKGQNMAGIFSHNQQMNWGWYARRQ